MNATKLSYRLKQIDFNGSVTFSSEINITPSFPESYVLSQNFPNPFNPSTTIKFELPKDERITIKIYDILGKEVKTIVDDFRKQGRYSVSFDGSGLASGIYIYQLKTKDIVLNHKMLLIK